MLLYYSWAESVWKNHAQLDSSNASPCPPTPNYCSSLSKPLTLERKVQALHPTPQMRKWRPKGVEGLAQKNPES